MPEGYFDPDFGQVEPGDPGYDSSIDRALNGSSGGFDAGRLFSNLLDSGVKLAPSLLNRRQAPQRAAAPASKNFTVWIIAGVALLALVFVVGRRA